MADEEEGKIWTTENGANTVANDGHISSKYEKYFISLTKKKDYEN